MAQIIDFPRTHQPLLWKFASKRSRILQALKFLFNNLRAQEIEPMRMLVIYEVEGNENVFYLNLGFKPGEFARAVDEVMDNIKQRPDNWE